MGAVALAVLAAPLAGCNRGADWREGRGDPQAEPPSQGYVHPPEATAAIRAADGGVILSGVGEANVRLRLASPDGGAYGATADDHGRWSVSLPASAQTRLFGLSEETGGRVIQAEGYLAVLPPPGLAAVLLRAGGGAAVLAASSSLQIAAIDFDAAGAGVVSGTAKPGAPLRAMLDGAPAGESHAGPRGRFALVLAARLKPGRHQIQVQSGAGSAQAAVSVDPPPASVPGLSYRGARIEGGWRVDWLTPGGGPQTTVVFDPAGGAP